VRSSISKTRNLAAAPLAAMPCTVRIASPLRSYTSGAATVTARGRTLAEVLSSLEERCPGIRFRMIDEQDRIRPHLRLFVNSSEARELTAQVTDGDTVHVVCALSGG
jgi:sulfur-carrier protein